MKKIIQILLMCLIIAGIIIIATIGLNVGTKYSENTQISINIGSQFDKKDIKEITNEVFKGQIVLIQTVELYEDTVQIIVEEASEEQISELNTKINEKYGIENQIDDIYVIQNSNVRLRSIIKPYILPVTITSIIVILYAVLLYRKLGIGNIIYITAMNIVLPQVILSSIYAITRLPINRLTAIIAVILFGISITLNMIVLNKKKTAKEAE